MGQGRESLIVFLLEFHMKPLLNSLPETVFTTKVDDLLPWRYRP
jgi:hypothetical protein